MSASSTLSASVWQAIMTLTWETLGVKDTAKLLQISEGTVRSWISRGQVTAHRIVSTQVIAIPEIERIKVELLHREIGNVRAEIAAMRQ